MVCIKPLSCPRICFLPEVWYLHRSNVKNTHHWKGDVNECRRHDAVSKRIFDLIPINHLYRIGQMSPRTGFAEVRSNDRYRFSFMTFNKIAQFGET